VTVEGISQNLLITILIAADLAVCSLVVFYFLWGRRQDQKFVDSARIRKLVDSLGELVKESDRASRNLLDALNERHRRTEELFREIDTRERRLAKAIREAERMHMESENSEKAGSYSEVSRLAELGLNADEIAGRVRLPKGEIELILGLKR
jgi:hypothetical protein